MTAQTRQSAPRYRPTPLQRVSDMIGGRLSRVGERLGSERLIYNRFTFWNFHRVAVHSAMGVVQAFQIIFPETRRLLDVGAGSGAYAARFNQEGLHAVAIEHSPLARKISRGLGVDTRPFDLTRDPPADVPETFDVAYSFEVAEHLPEALGQRLVEFMARTAPRIVFSAAAPGQAGMGHINCQPKEYWMERFRAAGFAYRAELTARVVEQLRQQESAWWLINNLMVFERESPRLDGGDGMSTST